jgi:hypothetical protein
MTLVSPSMSHTTPVISDSRTYPYIVSLIRNPCIVYNRDKDTFESLSG